MEATTTMAPTWETPSERPSPVARVHLAGNPGRDGDPRRHGTHGLPRGQVTLTWRSGAEGAEIEVSETGEGIAEEYISRLTERFFRVDKGRSRDDGGIGLGLAIVKHALERHDAQLCLVSALGKGSTFTCHFPPTRIATSPLVPVSRPARSI
jgi:two-component system phosphate regulon sensor histidine kinase PhoR